MKTKRTHLIIIYSSTALLIIALIVALRLFAPHYIEKQLLTKLVTMAGLELLDAKVQHVGLTSADIRELAIKTNESRYLTIEAVRLDYTLLGLIRKHIDVLTLTGLSLELRHDGNQLSINGHVLPNKHSIFQSLYPSQRDILKKKILVGVKRLNIRRSRMDIHWLQRTWTLPFDMELKDFDIVRGEMTGSGKFSLNGNCIDISASLAHSFERLSLQITAKQVELANFTKGFNDYLPVKASGVANLYCQTMLIPKTYQFRDTDLRIELNNAQIETAGVIVTNQSDASGKKQPLKLHFARDWPRGWKFSATSAQLASPLPVRIDKINGETISTGEDTHIDAIIRISTEHSIPIDTPAEVKKAFEITAPAEMKWQLNARHTNRRGVYWTMHQHRMTTDPELKMEGYLYGHPMSGELSDIQLKGQMTKDQLYADATMGLKNLSIKMPDCDIQCPQTKIDLGMNLDHSDQGVKMNASCTTTLRGAKLNATGISAISRYITFTPSISNRKEESWILHSKVYLGNTQVQLVDNELSFRDLTINLPLNLSKASKMRWGQVSVSALSWNQKSAGAMTGRLYQENNLVAFSGKHVKKNNHKQTITFDGTVGAQGFQTKWYLHKDIPPEQLATRNFEYDLASVSINGTLSEDYYYGNANGEFPWQ